MKINEIIRQKQLEKGLTQNKLPITWGIYLKAIINGENLTIQILY